jgi:hypothetical protein
VTAPHGFVVSLSTRHAYDHDGGLDGSDAGGWAAIGPPEDTADQRRAANAVRREAAVRSWPPPLAWDDIDADLAPPATPPPATEFDIDDIAIERVLWGQRHL